MGKSTRLGVFALVCGVLAFVRSLGFGFVYDDHWTVEGRIFDLPLARLLRSHTAPDATRPAMLATVWLDHRLFDRWAAGYHAQSLLWYGAACALASGICLALSGRTRAAIVGAIVFALAPLHAEVVCAINYREDLIAAVGIFVPLLALVRKSKWPEALVALCFAFGLFGKESTIAFVPIALALLILPKARARMLARKKLLGWLGGILAIWAIWRGFVAKDDVPRAHFASLVDRVLRAARFVVQMTGDAILPIRAAPEHERLPPASPLWLIAALALAGVIVLLARRRSTRLLALGLAIAVLAPLAASPLVGPANEIADRYAFAGVLGGAIVWGWVMVRVPLAAFAPAAIALAVLCQMGASPWKSDRTLFLEATRCAPSSPRAWVGLSRAYRIDGDLDDADRAIERALALDPKFVTAHVTRAYNRLARGNVEGAREELALIHDLGGDDHDGVALASRCAALSPEDAKNCIR